ncbi:SPFH domain-containing protein [Brooklawnia cerclae]|uniref:Membrane protease subunit (Stomatin/prohibitin family) n=1 Tax=Brooklawnia cerclae TaxID=349934 RepID=A0ABX0SF65_9ACTN|nr:SPFH domain-containing protein [Brooklawnia cerclae]NIH57043.1 membrane protease subunit (stomatin/prohibitin family) [Brooklawnia cerclae]
MGLMDKLRGELVDIIEWLEDSRSLLAWRFPRYQNEIKQGAQLIVREGQQAIFVYRGQLADVFGPGSYTLNTESLPIMSTIQGWKYGFNSPFRSEVYFVNTRPVTDLRWGTSTPVTIRDPDFGMVQVRANGLCIVRVMDPPTFLRQVIGTDSSVDVEEITELIRRVITQAFSDLILQTGLGAIDLQGRQAELADKLRELVAGRVDDEFGLAIDSITMNVSLPDEITQAMTRGVAKGVEEAGWLGQLGDLNRYQQAKQADAMTQAASNPGGSGGMGDAMGFGLGMAMAQQMAQQANQQTTQQAQTPPPLVDDAQAFHVELNGQAAGPYNVGQLRGMVEQGQLTPSTLVWSPGMAGWAQAVSVPALRNFFAAPPPLPPAAASGSNA